MQVPALAALLHRDQPRPVVQPGHGPSSSNVSSPDLVIRLQGAPLISTIVHGELLFNEEERRATCREMTLMPQMAWLVQPPAFPQDGVQVRHGGRVRLGVDGKVNQAPLNLFCNKGTTNEVY